MDAFTSTVDEPLILGLLYRDSLRVKKIDVGEKTSFEFTEWTARTTDNNMRLLIIYRPPYSAEHPVSTTVFFRELSDHLESTLLSKEQILIVRDFNIHIDNINDPDAVKLLDFLESFGLQHVTRSTHTHGHILDLIALFLTMHHFCAILFLLNFLRWLKSSNTGNINPSIFHHSKKI